METIPSYAKLQKDQQQFFDLKRSVYKKVNSLGKERLKWIKIKTIILPIIYFAFYIVALNQNQHLFFYYILYAGMGITMVFLFLNIIHEASN